MAYVGVFKDKDNKYHFKTLQEERRQQDAEREAIALGKKIKLEYVTVDHSSESDFL